MNWRIKKILNNHIGAMIRRWVIFTAVLVYDQFILLCHGIWRLHLTNVCSRLSKIWSAGIHLEGVHHIQIFAAFCMPQPSCILSLSPAFYKQGPITSWVTTVNLSLKYVQVGPSELAQGMHWSHMNSLWLPVFPAEWLLQTSESIPKNSADCWPQGPWQSRCHHTSDSKAHHPTSGSTDTAHSLQCICIPTLSTLYRITSQSLLW